LAPSINTQRDGRDVVTTSALAPPDETQVIEVGAADQAAKKKHPFRADVQALRAVAVLTVVLYHAHIPYLTGGYVGVDVFFVISGFLITGLLVREKDRTGTISIKKFYGRRMRRIMPAAALTMIATVVASYHWLGYIRGAHIAEDAQWSSVFLANVHYAAVGTDYLNSQDPPSTLQHFWSLSVEEQFYVVWPVMFLVLGLLGRKYTSRWMMIVPVGVVLVASYAFSIYYTAESVTQAYFSPFTRACELAAGAMLAVNMPSLKKIPMVWSLILSIGGMIGILVTAFTFTDATTFPGAMVAVPVLATCAILAGGSADGATTTKLNSVYAFKPIQWIGLWSYSLYLVHWPILTIAEQSLGHVPPPLTRVVLVVGAVGLAGLSYAFIENPVRNWKLIRKRSIVSIFLGLVLIFLVVFVTATLVGTHPAIPVTTYGK
jgi:peptidoglycan/LPS O-acetylase OafA/YrhL